MKAKRTKKQIASATKNILAYEKKDDFMNITTGFVLGVVSTMIAGFLGITFSVFL